MNAFSKIDDIQNKLRGLIEDLEELKLELSGQKPREKINEKALGVQSHMIDIVESFTDEKNKG